ncbi:YbaY family lipoprotein [Knoellia sp. CPCC 206450]|uniref:YbaY family lipoprotein n=1 Tax=Knoellia tibetensis TaxID=3404798 RepID=UPI003B42DF10
MATVHVRIEWPDGVEMPAAARCRVTVENVSRLDAASTVVGETVVEDLDPDAPVDVEVDVPHVDDGSDLVVRVHVVDGARRGREVEAGDLLTTQSHPVLTRGRGSEVVVHPRRIG